MTRYTEFWFAISLATTIALISCVFNNWKQERTINKLKQQKVVILELCGKPCEVTKKIKGVKHGR